MLRLFRCFALVFLGIGPVITGGVLLTTCFLLSRASQAQIATVEEKGLPPNSSFQSGNIDTINLENGNIHAEIPIESAKQRGGITLQWKLIYDGPTWLVEWIPNNCGQPHCTPTGQYNVVPDPNVYSGWRLSTPGSWNITNNYQGNGVICLATAQPYVPVTGWAIEDPEGTWHPFPLRQELDGSCNGQTLKGPATDGSGMVYDIQANILYLKDGTQINFGNDVMTDANGNQIQLYGKDTLGHTPVTTSTGPTITYTSPKGNKITGPQYTRYTVSDSNGTARVYEEDYQAIDFVTDACAHAGLTGGGITQFQCNEYGGTNLVPSQLVLQNNKKYVFHFNNSSTGELAGIDLPTGASISYSYTNLYQIQPASGGLQPNYVGGRVVQTRIVTTNGVASKWQYNVTLPATTVTDPMNNVEAHEFSTITVKFGGGYVNSNARYETSATYSDSAGHVLKTVSRAYAAEIDPVDTAVANVRETSTTTALAGGEVSQTQTDYETFQYNCYLSTCPGTATRLNPTEKRIYQFGQGAPGALLQRIDYSYLHTAGPAYQSLNIVNKPTAITTYSGTGAMAAQVKSEYDNYSRANQAMQASGAIDHSSSYGTGFTTRGNRTAVSMWKNTDGSYPLTTYQFTDAGNILSKIDPLGHSTSYSYSDAWANNTCDPPGQTKAFVTKETDALGHISSATYYACTGQIASSTDPNLKQTTISYDLLNRPKQLNFPDTGATTFCYSDDGSGSCYSATVLSVTETDKMTNSANFVRTAIFDGLGRTVRTEVTSDSDGIDYLDTTYDLLGRVRTVTNPYRGSPNGITTYTYDALSRKTIEQEPDTKTRQWCYDDVLSSGQTDCLANASSDTLATWIDYSDETGRHWQTARDALGRMTAAMEPDGTGTIGKSPSMESDYQYDILGNLTRVDQWGGPHGTSGERVRTFVYDSLSELKSACNPETVANGSSCSASGPWSDSYTYDAAGNMHTRTDARGVTTTNSYDALNRITGKVYTNDPQNTPAVSYSYDVAIAGWGWGSGQNPETNLVGRLSSVSTESPVAQIVYGYDAMGRTTLKSECLPGECGSDHHDLRSAYDFAGDMTFYDRGTDFNRNNSNPNQGYYYGGETMSYNGAERINGVTADTTDPNHPANVFSNATYTPYGALASGEALQTYTFTRTYSIREWLTGQTTNMGGQAIWATTYAYSNNGNIQTSTDTGNGSWTYYYDNMSRLTQGDGPTVSLNWSYDAFGNRKWQTISKGTGTAPQVSYTYNTNNHIISGATYDSAGNILNDGNHGYTYDAEGRIHSVDGTTSYDYDGEGNRVAKLNGGAVQSEYLYDFGGRLMSEVGLDSKAVRANVYIGGELMVEDAMDAKIGAAATMLRLADQVGTLRSRWDVAGNKVDGCISLPWGDGVSCTAASSDMMFTGKQRDTESGLDNFGARYYDSTMARFLTPDWSAHLEPVPYAKLNDPQSLDLYSYVENSPARRGDPDGHAGQPTGQSANNNWYGDVGVNDLELCQGSPVCFLYMLAQDVNSDAWNELQNAFQSLKEKPDPKNAGEQAQRQSDEIAARINHETLGMKDSKTENESLESAEVKIAHVRLNGMKKWGKKVQKYASLASPLAKGRGYKISQQAMAQAIREDAKGIDPTHGAIYYNMRTESQFKHGGSFQGQSVHTYSGPFISPSKYKYIMTYGPDPK